MRRFRLWPALCGGLLAGLVLLTSGGCLPFPGDDPVPVANGLRAEYIVSGAAHPSALAFATDGRVFYTEKNTGRIRVVVDGTLQAEPVATVPVNTAGDRGLLGIALHPNFDTNGRIYVFYTRSDTGTATNDPQAAIDNRVVYFETAANLAVGGEVFVASLPTGPGTTRVSGRLAFTADGHLLVAMGDMNDLEGTSDRTVLRGKILHYNDDGSIPDDNPLTDSPYYARGFRDVRGLCIDPENGAVLAVDRYADAHEEINLIQADGDYGWPVVAGLADTDAELAYAGEVTEYVEPLFETAEAGPGLIGGGVNPSNRYGDNVRLSFFYGEIDRHRIIALEFDQTRTRVLGTRVFAADLPGEITDVAFTPAGTLYVACENALFRIVPTP
ncbi:MAG: PQQ-dependent sugar dehydrogenase [Phycisphaerae bacterium]